jgi:cationic amino acid transporter 3
VGEGVGFVIGWNLILEYAIGTASVARGYSGYLDSLLNKTMATAFRSILPINVPYLSPYPDLCAFSITLLLTLVLCIGVKESSRFNNIFTCLNICVVIFVTFCGLLKANLHNWQLTPEEIPEEK